jgi:hypothetical protein
VSSGLQTLAAPPIWRDWLGGRGVDAPVPPDVSEAEEFDVGFDLENNRGVALIAMGAILLLAGLCALWEPSPTAGSVSV